MPVRDARVGDEMRVFATIAGIVGFFVGGMYFGGNLLGLWDEVEAAPVTGQPAAALKKRSGDVHRGKRARAAKKAARNRTTARKTPARARPARVRVVEADVAVAKRAVLRLSDMRGGGWRRLPVSADKGPGCASNKRDLSRFTMTGQARSAFKGGVSEIESRVKVFANARDAAGYFSASFNRAVLRCIRNGVKGALQRAGLQPRVAYARFQKAPSIGSQTAIYVVGYILTLREGRRYPYPVDLLAFRVGRSVGVVSFTLVPSDDGSRPCSCEFDEARRVASRLSRA